MTTPLVSIVCITYNQELYLRQALDSFLMQAADFPFEVILADDCSTDGTRAICEEYSRKYPDFICYLCREKNIGVVANENCAIQAAKGKYIALCEGDDYWTDPLKLQKQVAFMESHPEYSVTFHRYRIHYEKTDLWMPDNAGQLFEKETSEGCEITIEQSLENWITQYLTAVFRRDCYDSTWPDKYKWYRDSHLFYHLMTKGRAFLFSFDGGVYRQTGNGMYSTLNESEKQLITISVCRELWENNEDERLRAPYIKALQFFIDSYYKEPKHKKDVLKMSFILLCLTHNIKLTIKNLMKVLK